MASVNNGASPDSGRIRRRLTAVVWFALGTTAFAVSYLQAPLYFSNQNQYFLHGAAAAGLGHLDEDWLAQTRDPTPIFSALVAATFRYLDPICFYGYYALLQGIYFFALLAIFRHLGGGRPPLPLLVSYAAIVIFLHSALLRFLSVRLLGVDYPWYLQAGVAGQYVLGPMLQPSTFGVLLLASIWAFLGGRTWLAAMLVALAGTLHSTYLLPGAMLTLAYMAILCRSNGWKMAIGFGACTLLLVLPIVVYQLLAFRPTSPETFAEAQRILVHFRIPHHCIVQLWLDEVAGLQLLWLIVGIILAWGSPLFWVMLIPALLGLGLTLVQVVTASDTLALLFPWRISVILIPLATAVIVSRLTSLLGRSLDFETRRDRLGLIFGSATITAATVVGAIAIATGGLAFQSRAEEEPMMSWVRDHVKSGDTYLLPVRVPELKKTVRGSQKSDFKPLRAIDSSKGFIPVDLQRFRLFTGAPIFVDFKSIPYRDADVLEWRRRLDLVQRWYRAIDAGEAETIVRDLRRHGITHVVVRADRSLPREHFELRFEDRQYRIYECNRGA